MALEMPLDAGSYCPYLGTEGQHKVYSLCLSDLWIAIIIIYHNQIFDWVLSIYLVVLPHPLARITDSVQYSFHEGYIVRAPR